MKLVHEQSLKSILYDIRPFARIVIEIPGFLVFQQATPSQYDEYKLKEIYLLKFVEENTGHYKEIVEKYKAIARFLAENIVDITRCIRYQLKGPNYIRYILIRKSIYLEIETRLTHSGEWIKLIDLRFDINNKTGEEIVEVLNRFSKWILECIL